MSRRRIGIAAIVVVAVGLTGIGWWWAESHFDSRRFDACHWEGSTLVLEWTYGLGQVVRPQVDVRSADHVVVDLEIRQKPGTYEAIGLRGTLRSGVYGGPMPVREPDGQEVACPRSG